MPRTMTRKENKDFGKAIIIADQLDEAIARIARNLKPEDIFTTVELNEWAEDNGWGKI